MWTKLLAKHCYSRQVPVKNRESIPDSKDPGVDIDDASIRPNSSDQLGYKMSLLIISIYA